MKESTTAKNTKIAVLADKIQMARKELIDSNPSICFSESDSRRIVLICILYLCTNTQNNETVASYQDVLYKLRCCEEHTCSLYIPQKADDIKIEAVILRLSELMKENNWRERLIYAFEALEYGIDDFFSVKRKRGIREIAKKKDKGIFYTPSDVVSFMVDSCISTLVKRRPYPAVLDCSCGSGVFLLQCLIELENEYNPEHRIEVSLSILERCIWGIDISDVAIDICMAVFAQYYLTQYCDSLSSFGCVWNAITNSFFVGDGSDLQSTITRNALIPARFDCIIGNPPYVTLGKDDNLFIDFVYNMICFSTEDSLSSLVLPLSVCYAQGERYVSLRKWISQDSAAWTFLNYDRSPDSLFGDQIKTRNTILFRDAMPRQNAVYSSCLQRWTSEERDCLFDKTNLCDISNLNIQNGIAKISGEEANILFRALYYGDGCPFDLISKEREHGSLLVVNGTAYNWLCVYDHIPPSVDENGDSYMSKTSRLYYAVDEMAKYFCIALLSNRIAYWFWSAIGDGFHLNSSFLKDFRIGKAVFSEEQYDYMCMLGRKYCSIVRQNPTVSYNAGKTLVNYSHWKAMDVVEEIEKTILLALDLSNETLNHIAVWYENHVKCNRE